MHVTVTFGMITCICMSFRLAGACRAGAGIFMRMQFYVHVFKCMYVRIHDHTHGFWPRP
jgi:hypothetical protein